MSKQALLAVVFLLVAAALSPTPAGAADQGRAQPYSQFVQMSTQLMGELQNSERELIDVLQTMKRDADNRMQSYGAMRDSEFRTSDRVMAVR